MPIQWFPGHMNVARKKVADTLAEADLVIEVVDARLPEASSNPMIHELRRFRNRPCLRLLNKCDLADPAVTAAWLQQYQQDQNDGGLHAVAISCKKLADVRRVPELARRIAPHRDDASKPLRALILGVPNVGKSTLLNALAGRKVAKVGDEPAVTKQMQRIDISPLFVLFDTPGLMWPKIEHDSDGFMLAASHAIGVNALIEEEVAVFLAGVLLERYPLRVAERYRLDAAQVGALDGQALLEIVGRKRGCVQKGGGLDLEKAARALLGDYRDGALGQVSLESPTSRAEMLIRAAAELEAKRVAQAQGQAESAGQDPAQAT